MGASVAPGPDEPASRSAGLELLPAAGLGPGVRGWFTTRRGGHSGGPFARANLGAGVGDDPRAVARNRAALVQFVGAPVTWIRAVHGAGVGGVDDDGAVRPLRYLDTGRVSAPGEEDEAPDLAQPPAVGDADPRLDALVTSAPGRALAALAADCVPILLAAHDAADRPLAVAAVHSGRRGVALGVVTRAAEELRALAGLLAPGSGYAPASVRVRAVVGPAICGQCYEVPDAMRAEVAAAVPEAWATTRTGSPALDLPAAVLAQLRRAGCEVSQAGLCTRETPWLFSHRREHPGGRAGAVVVIDPARSTPARRAPDGDTPGGVPVLAPRGG